MTTRPRFAPGRCRREISSGVLTFFMLAASAGCTGHPEDTEDVGEVALAQVVCADDETVEGIDVSVYQANVDWNAVAADGIKFAIARSSYGTTKDTYFDQNWPAMKAAGLVRGAYQYWLPAKDPVAQAQAMLDIMGPLSAGDLPPVVDVEQTDGLGPAEIASRLQQWIDHVEGALGVKPIIYSGKYFWQDNVKSDAFLDYPLWIPNYSLDCPDLASGYWPSWDFFQYSSTGSVDGVSGNVDRNLFNGSLQDLYAFASGGPKYAAKFVSQSFPYASEGPLTIFAGQSATVTLEMQNTGTEPWNESTRLATTEPRDRESPFAGPEWPGKNRYAQVEGVVMPGETYKFTWKMHAPEKAGDHDEHMGLVQEGVAWFSDPGQGGPADGQLQGLFRVVPYSPHGEGGAGVGGGGGGTDAGGNGGDGGAGGEGADGTGSNLNTQSGCSTSDTGGGTGAPLGGSLFAAALGFAGLLRRRNRR